MSESEVPSAIAADLSLRHVMLVGGTLAQWHQIPREEWTARVDELGQYLGSIGVPWLTVRPYEAGLEETSPSTGPNGTGLSRWSAPAEHSGCTVIIDPSADGHRRFADAMQMLPSGDEVNEVTVSEILYEPADSEPDLVVVLGPSDQLPPSLVWEIAYAELYFANVDWADLTKSVLEVAVGGFADRRRRFGGLAGYTDVADPRPAESDSDEFETDDE